jgi:hypothetical protein
VNVCCEQHQYPSSAPIILDTSFNATIKAQNEKQTFLQMVFYEYRKESSATSHLGDAPLGKLLSQLMTLL